MAFSDKDIEGFTSELASKAAVPGGGGASALVGAVAAALGSMVGNLTVGKAKYADVEDEVRVLMAQADDLRAQLLHLIDRDAEVFEPLSKAYGIPKSDPGRAQVMEDALDLACSVPLEIMRTLARVIEVHARLAQIGSRLALSDVGVGAALAKAALQGASLNVFINTKAMGDRPHALELEEEADALLGTYVVLADETYSLMLASLRG
jgi:formiminotetrahydrofolate cyclodeaminase